MVSFCSHGQSLSCLRLIGPLKQLLLRFAKEVAIIPAYNQPLTIANQGIPLRFMKVDTLRNVLINKKVNLIDLPKGSKLPIIDAGG
jgi:hypothetical protein